MSNQSDGGNNGRGEDVNLPNQPSLIANAVREAKDGKSYFTKIGVGFAHKDGKGHTLHMDATPVNSKIVLRTPEDRIKGQRGGNQRSGAKRNDRDQGYDR